jgi:hypothetical protein
MKLRITQTGYQNFTGEMGHIEFVDGVSVDDVHGDFARSLSGVVQTEEVFSDVPQTKAPVDFAPEGDPL